LKIPVQNIIKIQEMIDQKLTILKLLEAEKQDILAIAQKEGENTARTQKEIRQSQEKYDKLLKEVELLNNKLQQIKARLTS
jgi:uncharacterized protein YlxW (UPF0749 family)